MGKMLFIIGRVFGDTLEWINKSVLTLFVYSCHSEDWGGNSNNKCDLIHLNFSVFANCLSLILACV